MKLKIGQNAPEFSLPDEDGKIHSFLEHRGRWILLYFYPKDDTPGCIKEACTLRDNFPKFRKLNVEVIGISADSSKSHKKFAEKYELPFILMSDEKKVILKKYGVWGEKKFMGHEFMGILRTSFLINPKGQIVKIYENVKPDGHAEEVLNDLKAL